ncbi:hypothetical protein LR392_14975 [Arthrobacter sp. AK04]|uniref:lipopolysaccharide biosynthesis protein n=1 Tax=Arthrobacter sp. AK04 TaxID=2900048 RepID=UPI001E42C7B6|nr:hypothetical protein [Arthrobacter sp. AK04]MCD5343526.1 hypothetical protein [Arthrobacter sp. AK04]
MALHHGSRVAEQLKIRGDACSFVCIGRWLLMRHLGYNRRLRQGWQRLVAIGIVDGISTVTASLGSKVQTLALLAFVTRAHGVDGVGEAILAISAALLLVAIADMGLSPQVMRLFAQQVLWDRRLIVRPLLWRAAILAPLSLAATAISLDGGIQSGQYLIWSCAIFLYAIGYQSSMTTTQLAYGVGRFKQAAALNGSLRAASVVLLVVLAVLEAGVVDFVIALSVIEILIAGFQYGMIPRSADKQEAAARATLRLAKVWKYGTGSIANTVMNRSDAVVVSLVASAGVIGVYGLASQVENALTTAALIPAGAVIAYTAKATTRAEEREIGRISARFVGVGYCLLATPFLFFTEFFVLLIFGTRISDPLPFQICIIAGLFSCLGGVGMQQLTGRGSASEVAKVWSFTAVFAVVGLLIGAGLWGALGASVAALARDVFFWGATKIASKRPGPVLEASGKIMELK